MPCCRSLGGRSSFFQCSDMGEGAKICCGQPQEGRTGPSCLRAGWSAYATVEHVECSLHTER